MEQARREFAEFYAAARDDCLRVVLISVGDRQLAEDLVAEAFTRAWMAWRKVSQHPAPQARIVRTALNAHVVSSGEPLHCYRTKLPHLRPQALVWAGEASS